jgi:hypothetical protein
MTLHVMYIIHGEKTNEGGGKPPPSVRSDYVTLVLTVRVLKDTDLLILHATLRVVVWRDHKYRHAVYILSYLLHS